MARRLLSRAKSLAAEGAVVGTFLDMSPEQLNGRQGVRRSDLDACAVMLYVMLTSQAQPIRLPVAGVPKRLSDTIDRGLAVDAEARFQGTEEMLAALVGAERELDLSGPKPPFRRKASMVGLKTWTIVAAVAMVLFYGVVLSSALVSWGGVSRLA